MRERLPPRPSPPEPQLIPIPMSDDEDDVDQPPQGERQRQRSRSRERVYHHEKVLQEPQIQHTVLQNLVVRYQMRILRLSIPHHHQLSRGIAPEDPKDPGHVSEYIHVHPRMLVNKQKLPVVPPPPRIQQNLASQSEDENSATVG